jgi:hypothetical protein
MAAVRAHWRAPFAARAASGYSAGIMCGFQAISNSVPIALALQAEPVSIEGQRSLQVADAQGGQRDSRFHELMGRRGGSSPGRTGDARRYSSS